MEAGLLKIQCKWKRIWWKPTA